MWFTFCSKRKKLLHRIEWKLDYLIQQNQKIMGDFEDVQALVQKLTDDNAAIKAGIATIIKNQLPASPGVGLTGDQVNQLKATLGGLITDQDAEVALVNAAATPAPVVTDPAPTPDPVDPTATV